MTAPKNHKSLAACIDGMSTRNFVILTVLLSAIVAGKTLEVMDPAKGPRAPTCEETAGRVAINLGLGMWKGNAYVHNMCD
jgi:hypothetical protein